MSLVLSAQASSRVRPRWLPLSISTNVCPASQNYSFVLARLEMSPLMTTGASLGRLLSRISVNKLSHLFRQSTCVPAASFLSSTPNEQELSTDHGVAPAEESRRKRNTKKTPACSPLETEMREKLGAEWSKTRKVGHLKKSACLANVEVAELVANHLKKDIEQGRSILEANPGSGYLSQLLVKNGCQQLYLYARQTSPFLPTLSDFTEQNPKTVRLISENILELKSICISDAMRDSNREERCFSGLPIQTDWSAPPKVTLFGVLTRETETRFLRSLLYMIPPRTGLFRLGPVELLLFISPQEYEMISAARAPAEYRPHMRAYNVLYSLLVECELLDYVSNSNFLSERSSLRSSESYLVRIRPRNNLPAIIASASNFEEFTFFIDQSLSRGSIASASLDMWIPQSYRRVFVEMSKPGSPLADLYFREKISGLSPEQLLELFRILRTHDGFEHSSFVTAFQNVKYKPNLEAT